MKKTIETIGLDADDTLWHNERFFKTTQAHFKQLLSGFVDQDVLEEQLLDAETRNLELYGFGVKSFTLSMIETAIEVTGGKLSGHIIQEILDVGREMLSHPIELLPHARTTIESLTDNYRVLLITKGDLLDQERKLAESGLGDLFDGVEIVSDKTVAVYERIFAKYSGGAERAMMVGNSLKSDVIPALDAGSWGVHVPHGLTWSYEHADAPITHERFREVADLGALQELLDEIN
ncbi:MAG: HAD family hydrolase [Hyphomicrobiales bacterium]|nr:MAG: HAD family hydrolase [Hyphomicrobiales bacterium]